MPSLTRPRGYCKICKRPLGFKKRKYCSTKCRNKRNYIKFCAYRAKWQRQRADKKASTPSADKVRCLICGRWYVQVGSHIIQRHKITARQYRELNDLEVKRGIVPAWYRKLKGRLAIDNKTYKNLKFGRRYWFKHGQSGVGVYHRSPITVARLKVLHTLNKHNKK